MSWRVDVDAIKIVMRGSIFSMLISPGTPFWRWATYLISIKYHIIQNADGRVAVTIAKLSKEEMYIEKDVKENHAANEDTW